MNTFEVKIWDDESRGCTFYTVQWTDAEESETDKFFKKHIAIPKLERSVQELMSYITEIIGREGALRKYFKPEDKANAIPMPGEHSVGELKINYGEFPLRLYCLRVTDRIVVLFNGAEKTSEKAKGGKTSMSFSEAQLFAKQINEALKDETIIFANQARELRYYDGSKEIIL